MAEMKSLTLNGVKYDIVDADAVHFTEVAAVGQTIRVSAVDENGKPTAWEAVDMASGGGASEWEVINEVTTTEEVTSVTISTDLNGQPFDLIEGKAYINAPEGGNVPDVMWYWYTSAGAVSYVNRGNGPIRTAEFYRNALSDGATIKFSAPDTSSATFFQKIGGYVFNQFRFLNWNGVVIPVGTRIRLIGRRKTQ